MAFTPRSSIKAGWRSFALSLLSSNVGAIALFSLSAQPSVSRELHAQGVNILFSVPVAADGVTYVGTGSDESHRWGPASFRVSNDGTYLIADTAGNRILRISKDGGTREVFSVPGARAVTDVAFDGGYLMALDLSALAPTLYTLRRDGNLVQAAAIENSISKRVTGLAEDVKPFLLELDGGSVFATQSGELRDATQRLRKGRSTFSISKSAAPAPRATITINDTPISLESSRSLGTVKILGAAPNGDTFVLVEELDDSPEIRVDQTVRRFSTNGEFVGIARVPIQERSTYVANGVAVTPEGEVVALITREDRADVVRLSFSARLPPLFPQAPEASDTLSAPDATTFAVTSSPTACRSQEQMIAAASDYTGNTRLLSSVNLNSATCRGRTKPRYLGSTAGTYGSVPYDWGGFDTVSEFNTYMGKGFAAGDTNTAATESCSRGVDCSGFLSRVWGTSRYTTRTLPGISKPIARTSLQRGDILNKSGDHVVMVDTIVQDGVYTFESTMYNSYDRVVRIFNGWGRFNGYTGYRYNNVCSAVVPAPAEIQSPAAGSRLAGTTQLFKWTTGVRVDEYFLYVGTGLGQNNIYGASVQGTSVTVNGLPTNGATIWVRLWSRISGTWHTRDTQYLAANPVTPTPATMITPAQGSTFAGSTQTFKWNTGQGVSQYFLYVGTGPGLNNIYGASVNGTAATVYNIPRNGSFIYVRLWSLIGGTWYTRDYWYRAAPR